MISLKTNLCYGRQMFSSLLSWRPNLNRRYSLPLSWLRSLGEESEVFPATAPTEPKNAEEVFFGGKKLGEIVGFTPILMAEACWSHILPLTSSQQSHSLHYLTQFSRKPCPRYGTEMHSWRMKKGGHSRHFLCCYMKKKVAKWWYCQQTPEALNVCLQVGSLSQLWGWHNPRVAGLYLKSDVLFIRLIGWQGSFIPTYSIYGTLQSQCTD